MLDDAIVGLQVCSSSLTHQGGAGFYPSKAQEGRAGC